MKEHSILFNGAMVRAILNDRPKIGSNEQRKVLIDPMVIKDAYEAGHTIKEIADACGCSVQPIKRIMNEAGIKRRPAEQRAGVMTGDRNPRWRGGRRIRPDGYVEIWIPSGPMLEHRYVMEKYLGRPLGSKEVVHHRDQDKQNNAIDNLELTTQSNHVKHHIDDMHAARWGK